MDEGEHTGGFDPTLHSFTAGNTRLSSGVDANVFQCMGTPIHIFEMDKVPAQCIHCDAEVGMASASNAKKFRAGAR